MYDAEVPESLVGTVQSGSGHSGHKGETTCGSENPSGRDHTSCRWENANKRSSKVGERGECKESEVATC